MVLPGRPWLRRQRGASWAFAFASHTRLAPLNAVQPIDHFCNAVVLYTVILRFCPTLCRKRLGHEELEREAEHRGGVQGKRRPRADHPEQLRNCIGVTCSPPWHRSACMRDQSVRRARMAPKL